MRRERAAGTLVTLFGLSLMATGVAYAYDECDATAGDPVFVLSSRQNLQRVIALTSKPRLQEEKAPSRLIVARWGTFLRCSQEAILFCESRGRMAGDSGETAILSSLREHRKNYGQLPSDVEASKQLLYFRLQMALSEIATREAETAVRLKCHELACVLAASCGYSMRVESTLQQVLRIAKENQTPGEAAATMGRLAEDLEVMRRDLAERLLREAVAFGGETEPAAEALRSLGVMAFEDRHYVEAADSFAQFLAKFAASEQRFDVLYRRILARQALATTVGEYEALVPDIEYLAEKAPTAAERARAVYLAASIRRIQGKEEEAAAAYARVLEEYPESAYAKSAAGYLRSLGSQAGKGR